MTPSSAQLLRIQVPVGPVSFSVFKQVSKAWNDEPTLEVYPDETLAWVIRNLSGLAVGDLPSPEEASLGFVRTLKLDDGLYHLVKVPRHT